MRLRSFALLLAACFASPLTAQTITGYAGDSLKPRARVMPASGPGCYRDALLTPAGAFITRDTLCWGVKPVPPKPDTVPTPPPPPPPVAGLAFRSDWSAATGTSDAALHDSGKWNGTLCDYQPTPLVGIIASPAGMPGNAFVWKYTGPTSQCYMLQQSGRFVAPKVGESAFYRFYYVNGMVGDIAQARWLQATSIQSWEWKSTTVSGGKYALRFVTCAGCPYTDNGNLYARNLNANAVYRVEFRLRRIAASVAEVTLLVYDATGALVVGPTGWTDGAGRAWAFPGTYVPVSDADFHTFDMGNNDARPAGSGFMMVGSFGVRISADTSAWIGR